MKYWAPLTCDPDSPYPSCVIGFVNPKTPGGEFKVLEVHHVVLVKGHVETRPGPYPVHAGDPDVLKPYRNWLDAKPDDNPIVERSFQVNRVRERIKVLKGPEWDPEADGRWWRYLPDVTLD